MWRRFVTWTDPADLGPLRHALRLWPLATIPTFMVTILISLSPLSPGSDKTPFHGMAKDTGWAFDTVVMAPVLETLLMLPLIWLLLRPVFGLPAPLAALLSALVWAGLHAGAAILTDKSWTWGLGVLWIFFLMSWVFIRWWRQRGLWRALVATAGIHGFHNNTMAALLLLNQALK